MTDAQFFAAVLGGMVGVYWLGFTWGKWSRVIKELGRAA